MSDLNQTVFAELFKECCRKCFGYPVISPLSEPDSKLLSATIQEQTGLVIGAKSIKNYSRFLFANDEDHSSSENPTVATLDTFARYVLNAPVTNEIQRKNNESHYPYWFQYKSKFAGSVAIKKKKQFISKPMAVVLSVIALGIYLLSLLLVTFNKRPSKDFYDDFNSVAIDSLVANGWIVKAPDSLWWNKHHENPGFLTLYTLNGDNWSLGENNARIRNLMMRKIDSDCFTTEVHLSHFIPSANWQQAGILLSEDSTFTGKMIRLSISYNNYFGGYQHPAEILIQAISSAESGSISKPEEITHLPLFTLENGIDSLIVSNLSNTALKIEKKGNQIRFLYNVSPIESFAFTEAASADLEIKPRFVSLFAIQGWADQENCMPVYFDSFSFNEISCNN